MADKKICWTRAFGFLLGFSVIGFAWWFILSTFPFLPDPLQKVPNPNLFESPKLLTHLIDRNDFPIDDPLATNLQVFRHTRAVADREWRDSLCTQNKYKHSAYCSTPDSDDEDIPTTSYFESWTHHILLGAGIFLGIIAVIIIVWLLMKL